MSSLFQRYASVILSKDGKTGREFENLRIKFTVEKTDQSNPNTAKISIFNLNDVSVGLVEDGGFIILKVGYNGIPTIVNGQTQINPLREIVSIGNIANIQTIKQGVDRITTFETGDGEEALNNSTTDQTFPPGVSSKQVLNALVDSLGLAKGVIKGVTDEIFNNGLSVSGKTKDSIDKIAEKQGLDFSVQDGEVQILPKKQATDETAIFLSPENGLIGTPTRKSKDGGIEFIALLNPQIRPGRRVKIESSQVNGIFKVTKATYTGDNKDGEFIVKGEAE